MNTPPGRKAGEDVPIHSTQETDMTVFKQAHQGDVFLRRIAALPADAQPVPVQQSGRVTLALGETSGHHLLEWIFDRAPEGCGDVCES